jgi:hypothetical protein
MQSQSTRCFHEPTAGGYYYGPQRACQRYDEAACQASGQDHETVEQTLRDMLNPDVYNKGTAKTEGAKYIFAKVRVERSRREGQAWRAGGHERQRGADGRVRGSNAATQRGAALCAQRCSPSIC